MAVKRNRAFGLAPDVTAGGTDYDALVADEDLAGEVPEPTEWWPVTTVTYDKGITNLTHENQVRGMRGDQPPEPFKREPKITVEQDAYFEPLVRALYWAYGLPNVRTGTAPAAFTDTLKPIGYGSSAVPKARHLTWVRDGLIYRASGCQINNISVDLPMDDDATFSTDWMALYVQQRAVDESQGTPDFGSIAAVTLKLRDVSCFIDGSGTKVQDLQAASFSWGNQLTAKPYAGRDIVPDPAHACNKVWFPAENQLGSGQDIGYGLTLGSVDAVEEFKQDFARAEKIVFEIEECPIATTPAAVRIIRHTIAAGVHTGGGAGNLTKGDDITSPFTGSGYHSSADGFDIKTEVVHNTSTLLTN